MMTRRTEADCLTEGAEKKKAEQKPQRVNNIEEKKIRLNAKQNSTIHVPISRLL